MYVYIYIYISISLSLSLSLVILRLQERRTCVLSRNSVQCTAITMAGAHQPMATSSYLSTGAHTRDRGFSLSKINVVITPPIFGNGGGSVMSLVVSNMIMGVCHPPPNTRGLALMSECFWLWGGGEDIMMSMMITVKCICPRSHYTAIRPGNMVSAQCSVL